MAKREVWLDESPALTRMMVVEDGRPVEVAFERPERRRIVGNLYAARVMTLARGMNAAFVDIGTEKNAFLPLGDVPAALRSFDAADAPVAKTIRQGQDIVVQVTHEPGGDKGPRVTMNPSFPGKWVVLLPTVEAVGVSRRIGPPAERERLLGIAKAVCPAGMGLVIRTQAEGCAEADILAEVSALASRWQTIATQARARKAPALLVDDGSLAARAARDLDADIIRAPFPVSLDAKLQKALRRKVWLGSGAFLVIDRCEAMTVIDVNSGKYAGGKDARVAVLRLNQEAAREVAYQCRLRDIGGIVVVDFVDMETDADRETVLSTFAQALEPDRAKRHVYGFTAAGLLELTRRSVYQPVHEALFAPCSHCHGAGVLPIPDLWRNGVNEEEHPE